MSWLRRLFRRPKGLRYPNGVPRVIDEWPAIRLSTEGAIPRAKA